MLMGEGCFCQGPAVLHGDVLYRQSIGIEVWDVADPATPSLLGMVSERPGSEGGLAIARDHLISVRNIEAAISIYGLEDPRAPTLRATLSLDDANLTGLVMVGDLAVITGTNRAGDAELLAVDVTDLDAPTLRWRIPIEGRVANIVADGTRVVLLTQTVFGEGAWLDVRAAADGEPLARHMLGAGPSASSFFAGLATYGEFVLVGAPGALRVMVVGEELEERGRLEVEERAISSLAVFGDRVVMAGQSLRVVDLRDPSRPRELGRAEANLGDAAHLLVGDDAIFVSNGGGLYAVPFVCE